MSAARIVALGAGRMGRQIAHVFAYAGHEVALVDARPRDADDFRALADAALGEIAAGLETLAALGLFEADKVPAILERISVHPAGDGAAFESAAFVFEGVPERLETKADAMRAVAPDLPADAILASTTSTILVDALAAHAPEPARFLNAHWLNPAYLVPLVELTPSSATDPAVTAALVALLEDIGKVPVVMRPSPGFVVPRIQCLAMNEAARMVEEGIATPEAIDKALVYGFGFRFAVLGLLEFIDWGGNDILYYASRSLHAATGEERFRAPAIVDANMEAGRNGMRDGAGFHDWAARDVDAYKRDRLAAFLEQLRLAGLARPPA